MTQSTVCTLCCNVSREVVVWEPNYYGPVFNWRGVAVLEGAELLMAIALYRWVYTDISCIEYCRVLYTMCIYIRNIIIQIIVIPLFRCSVIPYSAFCSLPIDHMHISKFPHTSVYIPFVGCHVEGQLRHICNSKKSLFSCSNCFRRGLLLSFRYIV